MDANTKKLRSGGSQNPIIFHDYESFIAKFTDKPKTTDECWTPRDVYEAVVKYVGEVYPLEGKQLLRPFYPGGDYEAAEYPADGIVIDNPPFSIFSKIVRFYLDRDIPFFLFGPALTMSCVCKYGVTAVFTGENIRFSNGAVINISFISNLFGDIVAMSAPRLGELLAACASQNIKANLPSYSYPAELLRPCELQTMASDGVEFAVRRSECRIARTLDNMPKGKNLFGEAFLTTTSIGKAKEKAKERAKDVIPVQLSDRERSLIDEM